LSVRRIHGSHAAPDGRSFGLSRLSGNLPGNAGSDLARARYLAEFWPEDQRRGRLKTRRLASPRKSSLFSFSDSHGNAPILAGLPISGENWARSLPHQQWWKDFLQDSGGTGFWHETYFMRGGMEAIYDDLGQLFGFSRFAPTRLAHGPMFSARKRLGLQGDPTVPGPVQEEVS